ncbi:hypothetical protein BFF78_39580 [Streptomyces fodineus]|uniref:SH3b domain-containing protein n=1 Tax=Streptomyces fodineus TaxID=1904616 RepID=A0A1D7YLC0_9ACTN|nr:hypothetical protein [Streptomyces fodineus]AOR36351.1 hypothetical protein BFF78_39580 [Streptomyces fodineus]
MIRRTLKSGLLATVAVLAFLPTAAGATAASAATPRPAPSATSQHPAKHRAHRTSHRVHRRGYAAQHRVHLRTHHSRRVHRMHRLTAQGAFLPQTAAYRITLRATPYHLRYRLAAQQLTYRHLPPVTGVVTTRHAPLNVRSGPGTGYRVIGHRYTHRTLALTCRTRGSSVHGNRIWYRLPHHAGYVSAHYIRANRSLPWC